MSLTSLTPEKIKELVRLVEATRDVELPCDECLAQLAVFVDANLAGKPLEGVLRVVSAHIASCRDCGEEYDALRRAVETI